MTFTWQRAIGLIVAFFAAQWLLANLTAVAASLFAALTATSFESIKPAIEASRGLIAYLGASLLVFLLIRARLRDTALREALGLRMSGWEDVALALASGLALGAFYVNLAGFLADAPANEAVPGAVQSGVWMPGWFLFALLIAPPVEEFLFRGLLQGTLSQHAGRWLTIGIVTAAFAVVHVPETLSFGPALLGIVSMALAAGWFRAQSASLVPPVAVHLGYNLALASAVAASLWL